jgi:hypothetical protein
VEEIEAVAAAMEVFADAAVVAALVVFVKTAAKLRHHAGSPELSCHVVQVLHLHLSVLWAAAVVVVAATAAAAVVVTVTVAALVAVIVAAAAAVAMAAVKDCWPVAEMVAVASAAAGAAATGVVAASSVMWLVTAAVVEAVWGRGSRSAEVGRWR